MSAYAIGGSSLHKFMFNGMGVRGVLVRITDEWQTLLQRRPSEAPHAPAVRRVLGEMTAACALLQANIKFDGPLIMQLYGDGALKLAVVEMQSDLRFRATAKVNGTVGDDDDLEGLANRHGRGRCALTLEPARDTRGQQPYQGIVPLNDVDGRPMHRVSEMIEGYMAQSEQLQSRLVLAADDQRIAGLLLQRLPAQGGHGASAPAWRHVELLDTQDQDEHFNRLSLLAASLTSEELLKLEPQDVLHRLYWDEPMQTLEVLSGASGPRFYCTCSLERVSHMLRSLGEDEVQDILREQGQVEIACEFCGKQYLFDAVDASELFVQQQNHPPGSQQLQ